MKRPHKKPLLIYLADPVHNYIKSRDNWFIPLNILYIASYAKAVFGEKVDIKLYKFPDPVMQAINERPPDLIGVSNYVWNYELSKAILGFAKKMSKDTVTVMGGPNFTHTAERATVFLKDTPCDYYISGAGEHPFRSLVSSMLKGHRTGTSLCHDKNVHAVWYLDPATEKAVCKPVACTIERPDEIPSPFQNGMVDEFFRQGLAPMLETNRGCPFACTYCVWGNRSKVLNFSIGRVKADIEYCRVHSIDDQLMINDANFGLFGERDLEIAGYIKQSHDKYGWPKNVIINWGQVESETALKIADTLKDVSIFRQSSQSMDPGVLRNIKRRNISHGQWKNVVAYCKEQGVDSFGELILMLPGETFASYLNALRYLLGLDIDCVNTNQLQLLEGAQLNRPEERERYRMVTKWRLLENAYGVYGGYTAIESVELVVRTDTFSFEEGLACRTLNWLIQMSWTLRRHDLLLRLLGTFGINPLDLLLKAVRDYRKAAPAVQTLVEDFNRDAIDELFTSKDELISYYSEKERIESLRDGGFRKLNTYYSGLALECDSDFIGYYSRIALEMIGELGLLPEDYIDIINECALFLQQRNLNDRELVSVEKGIDITKQHEFHYDFLRWDRLPTKDSLLNHHHPEGLSYVFYTDDEQTGAIRRHMKNFSGISREYQIRKLHEPYFGINKDHLLFRIRYSNPTQNP